MTNLDKVLPYQNLYTTCFAQTYIYHVTYKSPSFDPGLFQQINQDFYIETTLTSVFIYKILCKKRVLVFTKILSK